jgi:hypothetical protein
METKETFKERLESLRKIEKRGEQTRYGKGRLDMAETVENLILFEVGITFTEDEKQTLIGLITTELQTTNMNHSEKKWFENYAKKQNKLIEKIERQP